MNVERLQEIISTIKTDMDETKLVASIAQIMAALDVIMSQPPNPAHQATLKTSLESFNQSIELSKVNEFPTTWRPYIEEIGIQDLLGEPLRRRVEAARNRNEITTANFKDELQAIHSELSRYNSSFTQIVQGLAIFDFSATHVEPGLAELSFLFPREAFGNGMKAFGKEVEFFDSATRFFSEVATQGREEPRLNQLSTTDPVVSIAVVSATAYAFLKVVEKILCIMEKTYNIREAKAKAELAEASAGTIASLQGDIDAKIQEGLAGLKDWMFQEYAAPKGRVNELKTEADKILPKLASRIDNGFQVDGDINLDDEADLDEAELADEEKAKERLLASDLVKVAKQIRYRERLDGPVLELPKPGEEDEIDDNPE